MCELVCKSYSIRVWFDQEIDIIWNWTSNIDGIWGEIIWFVEYRRGGGRGKRHKRNATGGSKREKETTTEIMQWSEHGILFEYYYMWVKMPTKQENRKQEQEIREKKKKNNDRAFRSEWKTSRNSMYEFEFYSSLFFACARAYYVGKIVPVSILSDEVRKKNRGIRGMKHYGDL